MSIIIWMAMCISFLFLCMHMYERMKDWVTFVWDVRGKSEIFIVHVTRPLPCWVRSLAGQKYEIKVFIWVLGDEKARGFARLSSSACLVSFFSPALLSCVQQLASISGYLSLNRPCDYCCVSWGEAYSMTTHVDLRYAQHGDGYKQRLLQHTTRGTISIL